MNDQKVDNWLSCSSYRSDKFVIFLTHSTPLSATNTSSSPALVTDSLFLPFPVAKQTDRW